MEEHGDLDKQMEDVDLEQRGGGPGAGEVADLGSGLEDIARLEPGDEPLNLEQRGQQEQQEQQDQDPTSGGDDNNDAHAAFDFVFIVLPLMGVTAWEIWQMY